jgi:hypothetical protein
MSEYNVQLILVPAKTEATRYECSDCRRGFILPDDVTPKQAMEEVWAAFQEHVTDLHPAAGGAMAGIA